jgi:hypothetical protein
VRTGIWRSRHAVTTRWRSVPAVEDARQLCGRAEHLQAADAHALLARVVVDEADRDAPQPGIAAKLRDDRLAARATADDQHLAGAAVGHPAHRALHEQHPYREARRGDERQRQQQVECDHAARRVGLARPEEERADHDERRDQHRLHDTLEVLLVDEAPELVVQPERREDQQLADDDQQDRPAQQVAVAVRHAVVEAQRERQVVRERDQATVDRELEQPPCSDR